MFCWGRILLFECPDCKGKISRYYAELRVCQDCKKVVNISDLLRLLKNVGVTEQNIERVRENLACPRVFAA
jgi:hypothetical protein